MNTVLADELRRLIAPIAVRIARLLPYAWRSTARRRRLTFLAGCTPGFAAVAALPLHKSFWLLLSGALAGLAAWALRALSEPTLIQGAHHD